ncbi:MAG: hypothetical protein NTV22_04915, partial [bacterium]|nr:hypothetical protein [bacterium]
AQTDMQHITAACRAALAFGKSIEQVPQTQMEIAIVQAAAHEADRLLKANWGTVEKVATALLQRKTLTRKQVMQIVKLAVENIPPQGEHNEA